MQHNGDMGKATSNKFCDKEFSDKRQGIKTVPYVADRNMHGAAMSHVAKLPLTNFVALYISL